MKNKTLLFVILGFCILVLAGSIVVFSWLSFPSEFTSHCAERTVGITNESTLGNPAVLSTGDIDKLVYIEQGRKVAYNNTQLPNLDIRLLLTLQSLNLQATCIFSQERIQEIKQKDEVVELIFKQPMDIAIAQWVEPEERSRIPTYEDGYRILENVERAIFVLEDTQGEGLEGHVLTGSERKDRDERCSWKITQEDMEKLGLCRGIVGYVFSEEHGCIAVSGCKYKHIEDIVPFNSKEECELACGRIMWGCWAIRQEESNELDKTWIDRINFELDDKKFQKLKPIISVNSTVFEGARWMSILSDGKVTCYSDHYYPSHKEIVIKEGRISREEVDALLELFSNLSEYSEYIVNASEQLIKNHMDCIFDPVGGGTKISCIPLNKTLRLRVRPPSFPEPETATITAKEIMNRIDKIYREAEVSEKRKEINPYLISLNFEPYAPSYQPNQMITFNASSKDGWLGNVSSYEWDFGDGSKGYGKIVWHSYSLPGNYTIRLKITSDDAVGVKDKMIAIRSTPAPVIWIEKKVNPEIEHGAATTGGEVTITMAVENRRDKEIFDIEVRDEFPEGFKLISGDTSMDLASLKSGESKILKYKLRALEAGYFVLKPATLTYKDESGVQYSNKSNTAEVMVRAPPPGPPMGTIGRVEGFIGVVAIIAFVLILIYKKF